MAAAVDRILIASYPRRSCLSAPGHAVRMHEKAAGVPADEVVFDLEDAVAPSAKQQAREVIAQTLARPEWAQRTVAVRVNAPGSSELAADLELVGALRARASWRWWFRRSRSSSDCRQSQSSSIGGSVAAGRNRGQRVGHHGSYLMPGTPLDFSAIPRVSVRRAPQLGGVVDCARGGVDSGSRQP